MTFTITKQHLALAIKAQHKDKCQYCPVAQAVKDIIPGFTGVGTDQVRTVQEERNWLLGDTARGIVRWFDEGDLDELAEYLPKSVIITQCAA